MIGSSTVALCLLAHDDAGVLARGLPSLPPAIDTWVVVDIGSRDATARTVQHLWRARPGTIHHRPWQDLASNRSELLQLADGAADYLLVLDADEVLVGDLPASIEADAYEVLTGNDPSTWELRLVRSGLGWRADPVMPSRLVADSPMAIERHAGLVVWSHGDGGLHQRNLVREERLLVAAALESPADPDLAFVLAEVYREQGKVAAAIDLFRRRAAMGGDEEDGFYAAYQAGALGVREALHPPATYPQEPESFPQALQNRALLVPDEPPALSDWDESAASLPANAEVEAGIALLLEAWARRPTRAEPLYEGAVAARLLGQYDRALRLAVQGSSIPLPEGDRRVHRWVFEWGMRLEQAAALGHLGRPVEAIAIMDALLEQDGLAPWVDVDLLLVRQWLEDERVLVTGDDPWSRPLTMRVPKPADGFVPVPRPRRLEELVGPLPTSYLGGEMEDPWTVLNPSVANGADGFGVMLRVVNWRYREDSPEAIARGRYILQGGEAFNRNRHLLQLHGVDGDLVSTAEITEPLDRPRLPLYIRGFEDCRLFWWRDAWHVAFCVVDTTPMDLYQMAMARIDGDRFTEFVPLLGPPPPRPEKNWVPFVDGDRLLFVYSCHPFVVLEWDPERLDNREVRRLATPQVMAGLRGGTQGVRVDDGWVFVMHERRMSMNRPLYVHRLLKVDDSLTPVGLSPAFVLQQYGIEFAAGMAAWGSDLLLSYGVQDRTAWLSVVPRDRFLELLEPIDLPASVAEVM